MMSPLLPLLRWGAAGLLFLGQDEEGVTVIYD